MPHDSTVCLKKGHGIIRTLVFLRIRLLLLVLFFASNTMVLFSLTVSGVARQATAFNPRPALKRLQPLLSRQASASAAASAIHVESSTRPVPMTLLSGFLGTGKTTTLKHLLENTDGLKIGVVVNDVAAVNIDSKLVAKETKGEMVELQNGCACCSIADELFTSVEKLCANRKLDAVIVECKYMKSRLFNRTNLSLLTLSLLDSFLH